MVDDTLHQLEEFDYFTGKKPDRTYISKSFESSDFLDLDKPRLVRILSKVFDCKEPFEFIEVKKEIVVRTTPGERQEVKILFYEDSRKIKYITIQRFTKKDEKPHKVSFSFSGSEIEKLYNILNLVKYVDLNDNGKIRLDDQTINEWLLTENEKRKFFTENLGLVKEITESHITKSDVIAFAYRKGQLEIFQNLLQDDQYFVSKKTEWNVARDEAVWQKFFEKNPWIFGYGLSYVFTSQLDDKKLEQVTTGFSFHESGKRTDALMKTRGLISSLCFVEIKTHKTPLLKKADYRAECWPISDELGGSIVQIQKTIQKAVKNIQTKVELANRDGDPTGEITFLYQPKSFVVIGCLDEFFTSMGINEQKFSCFELFRRNINNPEIITFDELFERARYIIKHTEEDNKPVGEGEPVDELPF